MLDALLEELDAASEASAATYVSEAPRLLVGVRNESVERNGNAIAAALRAGRPASELELVGAMLHDVDLSEVDFTEADLSGANLARATLTGAQLFGCNLRGAMLYGATLDDADFTGADLTDANLETATGRRTGFGGASLVRAKLAEAAFQDAAFAEADLDGADLRGATFARARAVRARLTHCDATSACFAGSNLREVTVTGSSFDHANLRDATLTGVHGYEHATWIGADTRDVPPQGVFMWKRFVTDQNYLAEFRTRGRLAESVYWMWWATSDCGRSMLRWMICTTVLVAAFGTLFSMLAVDYGPHATWLSPYYFSVITITSLGYGDVLPISAAAQAAAMLEVTIGYLMLGGLLSILSNKMARRGD